jgi:AIR synthase related protein, C-terminal domain
MCLLDCSSRSVSFLLPISPVFRCHANSALFSPLVCICGGFCSAEDREELDFKAVQRGDPEMEQKVNRVIRACIELGPKNPILSIHDQGAGGNGNVLKELVHPSGALIDGRFSFVRCVCVCTHVCVCMCVLCVHDEFRALRM